MSIMNGQDIDEKTWGDHEYIRCFSGHVVDRYRSRTWIVSNENLPCGRDVGHSNNGRILKFMSPTLIKFSSEEFSFDCLFESCLAPRSK